MSGRVADYRLKIGFGGGIGGRYTIGTSTIGGSDIFATDWTEFFTGPYDDVTDDIAENSAVTCSRGLDVRLAAIESGKSQFTLIRPSNISFYDPNEPTSPLNNGSVSPGFVPMRPVQCTAYVDDVGGAFSVSGNEVTDATRAAEATLGLTASGQMCDGLSNDGSFGIRRAATNLFRRGQCDATTDWSVNNAGMSVSIDAAAPASFSPQSIKYVVDGTVTQMAWALSAVGQAAAAGVNGVGSVYFKGTAGQTYQSRMVWTNTDASNTVGAFSTFVATGDWQLIAPPALAVAAGKTGDRLGVQVGPNSARAETYRVAHAMLEKGQSVVAPYVATSGGATATHAAGRVQAPASLLGSGKRWFAARLRFGYSDADIANFGFNPRVVTLEDDATHRFTLVYNRGGGKNFTFIATNGGANVGPTSPALGSVNAGDYVTVIGALDSVAKTVSLSVNGGAFVTASVGTDFPTIAASMFDIGTELGNNPWNGDVLWFACGTGTLTDTDAAWFHAELVAGREPMPADINDRSSAAACTAANPFNTANYTIPNVQKGVFYHFIRDAKYDPETGLCTIQAEDLLYWLSRIDNPIISSVSGITSSQAVGLILDSIGFTDPAFRQLTATPSITNITFGADGTQSALDLLKGILDAEQGRMFVDGSGVFHFEDRYARERRTAASHSFSTELFAINSRAAADTIGNRATVTGATGGAQVAQDTTSIHNFGVGDIGSITSTYIPDAATASALAALILMRIKDPHPPQRGTIDNDSAATMSAQLAVELQDRVTISGTDGYVERIEHTIAPGGVRHTTSLTVSQVAATTPFVIGASVIADPAATAGDYIAA